MESVLDTYFASPSKVTNSALEWSVSLEREAVKVQEIMMICAIIIFPAFAFFDVHTIPAEHYWKVTYFRLGVTASIAFGLFLQRKFKINYRYLGYWAFLSITFFCCYATLMGGEEFLYEHNAATCTVFLAGSLFYLWHWIHSIIMVVGTIIFYVAMINYLDIIPLSEVLLKGGSMLLTVMVLYPLIVAYRYISFRNEYFLKKELELSYSALQVQKNKEEEKNKELVVARVSLYEANAELQNMNDRLENLVKERTLNLQETNANLKNILEELDLFLYSSYHDLKGPVARLLGLAQLAKIEISEDVAHFYIDKFIDNIKEMELLMTKLNKVNHTNIIEPNYQKIGLEQKFQELIELYTTPLFPINISYHIEGSCEAITDESLLTLIVEALLENALQFRKGKAEDAIRITALISEKTIELTVHDNGVGISNQTIPDIFKMFFRGNESSKGHGLGLYIAKKATEKLSGGIKVMSEEYQFTEFVVSLPNQQ